MSSIGRLNETNLHEQLKDIYADVDGYIEETVDGFVIDVVRGNELVEVQTRGFGKLRRKIEHLSGRYRLRIVYPVAERNRIVRVDAEGVILGSRRSPKRGRLESLFRELASIADLLPHPAVTVEVVMVRTVEERLADGKGSWRRNGVSIVSRAVEEVVATHAFLAGKDYLALLPAGLPEPFTNQDLAATAGLRYALVQPMTSSFRKMGLIAIDGKRGRELLYRQVPVRG